MSIFISVGYATGKLKKKQKTIMGRQFDNDRWRNFWKNLRTEVTYISANRPASNPCERVMSTLGDMLRLYSRGNHRRWTLASLNQKYRRTNKNLKIYEVVLFAYINHGISFHAIT